MTDLQLEVDHCHAVCAELRAELDKAKADRLALELELQAVSERLRTSAGQVQELLQTRHTLGNQLYKAKAERDAFAKDLDTANERIGELTEEKDRQTELADCLSKAILLAERQGLTAAELRAAINMVAK
jgi:chromosome segregation ATPase